MFNMITWEIRYEETERRVGSGQCQHEKGSSYFVLRSMYLEEIPKGIMWESHQLSRNQNTALDSWAIASVFAQLFWPYQGKETTHSVVEIFFLTELEKILNNFPSEFL